MSYNFNPVDRLVSDIVGTANIISKVLFNRTSIVAAAAISFLAITLAVVF